MTAAPPTTPCHAWRLPAQPPGPHWHPTLGAQCLADGAVRFRVWAPRARSVALCLVQDGQERRLALAPTAPEPAVYEAVVPALAPGSRYGYSLDGAAPLPDPVSRHQPDGVHGLSAVVAADAYRWSDGDWSGLPLEEAVFYELHVGTFSPAGSFAGVAEQLEHLRALGVTAVELMPVAEFPGGRNWGYDGVHPYAPQSTYGGPPGLKALVDACHGAGLAVVLDVVYNHLGPEGNYLPRFGPYFSGRYHTPWGDALNYDDADCEPVRRHIIENALYWLTEYHIDGLRLDAVHGIFDNGARHVLAELAEAFHRQADALGRTAWLIAESDLNDPRVIDPPTSGGWGLDAQWSDDFHHALRAVQTGSRHGYFADFGQVAQVAKALDTGFVYDGGYSAYRRRRHGASSAHVPGRQLVACIQNHDQIANAGQGRRVGALCTPAQQRVAAALLLCGPHLPLLFMGEEYADPAPFHYFTSHGDEALARAVTMGRLEEQRAFGDAGAFAEPQQSATFDQCRLRLDLAGGHPHAALLAWYRGLLALRQRHACLGQPHKERTRTRSAEAPGWLMLHRTDVAGGHATLLCTLSDTAADVPLPADATPGQLALWSEDVRFGGDGAQPPPDGLPPGGGSLTLGPWQAALYLQEAIA